MAFVNTFIFKTVTFLDEFLNQCESKFSDFEQKLHRVDTQLQLIEAKLGSIPGLENSSIGSEQNGAGLDGIVTVQVEAPKEEAPKLEEEIQKEETIENKDVVDQPTESSTEIDNPQQTTVEGVRAKDDYRYKKYFKLIQLGVPPQAIKNKLQSEGMDPDIIDDPNRILPDGIIEPVAVEMDSDSDESD